MTTKGWRRLALFLWGIAERLVWEAQEIIRNASQRCLKYCFKNSF
jgi:hypothetical protein